mgnify:CR=1 FL=1
MNVFLQIACRTIQRRLVAGENFENIIADYPKLTDEQIGEIKQALGINDPAPEESIVEAETEAENNE